MFNAFGWPIGRAGRTVLFFWLLLGSLGFAAVKFRVFGMLDLSPHLGLRLDALARPELYPLWYLALELLFDLALAVVAIGRLHDMDKPGWWLAGLVAPTGMVALTRLAGLPGAGLLGLVLLPFWLALLAWPGTFGRNRYGADPLGWESRAQYEAQMQALRDHVPPGKAS
jgi:uncharacterized membrane protein YhaH (DUF805 family)